jgi:RNA polymerase sigma-70 factor (ECF subfamily)
MRNDHPLWQPYVDGRDKWPSIDVPFEVFERFCTRTASAAFSPNEERHASDLYLCAACSVLNAEAIKALERGPLQSARSAIARIHNDAEFVRETLQELSVKLLVGPEPKIREYGGSGPVEAWLRVVATRAALDRVRSHREPGLRAIDRQSASSETSPESRLTRAQFGGAFQQALLRAIAELSAVDRNVLRMHVVGRCSIDQIGRAYSVHRATAARWLERAKVAVFEAVRKEFVQRRGFTESEFKSVAGTLCDDLRLGFSGDYDRPATGVSVEPSLSSPDA